MADIEYRLGQKRDLKTALPGPKSQELAARREKAVAAGVASSLPVFADELDGGVIKDVDTSFTTSRRYIAVDGGMSDNARPVLYDADYTAVLANRVSEEAPVLSRVVGKHCESGDIVVKDVYLPGDVQRGDLLVVPVTGAYCWSLASNYNHVPRPPIVAVREGRSRVIVRGETVHDLLARDGRVWRMP